MNSLPKKLRKKLDDRRENNSLRSLGNISELVDFSSNDYLGFSASEEIYKRALEILKEYKIEKNGATGSRLLSGNNQLYQDTETLIADFHKAETALIFNSGYDANLGFFGSVPQRGDVIFYDELIHASVRDGVMMSKAKGFKFKHNDLDDLKSRCRNEKESNSESTEIYIVTESIFSMDGDSPDLKGLSDFCSKNNCHLIVDEAHAIGVMGQGRGMIQELGLENQVFARIITFGKALGCHGAAVLGSEDLKTFLTNFARSFIYTTALAPHSIATIRAAYEVLKSNEGEDDDNVSKRLNRNIAMLRFYIKVSEMENHFIESASAIHCCLVSGNARVKEVSEKLSKNGFDVKPILSPTVPEGKERLRICLHSFNKEVEIEKLVKLLVTFIK